MTARRIDTASLVAAITNPPAARLPIMWRPPMQGDPPRPSAQWRTVRRGITRNGRLRAFGREWDAAARAYLRPAPGQRTLLVWVQWWSRSPDQVAIYDGNGPRPPRTTEAGAKSWAYLRPVAH